MMPWQVCRFQRSSFSKPLFVFAALALCAFKTALGFLQLSLSCRRSHISGRGCLVSSPVCIARQRCSIRPLAAEPEGLDFGNAIQVVAALAAGAWWITGLLERAKKDEARKAADKIMAEREARAFVEPRRKPWTAAELAEYDGTKDDEGPILMAVDGVVLNVWKGRGFYGPGGEYHIMAGRDATRLLAKQILEEETPEEAAEELNIAQKATLEAWKFTLTSKYQRVGTFETAPEK
eukprot:TRINITY_DN66477_c0_g1_i1.p1 TRINITY_DN66477_c0_g1~~TRINITY_DN66477_c0_g1_i1.p1  ORF type:complete len:235 (+),score=52.84 TRINITY_DN66477_c0_g1_i1:77-781(+)